MATNFDPRSKKPMADINVTPLVDVMLVLLVIFMISAPLLFNGIKLELPKTKKVNGLQLNSDQVILSISRSGELYIGKEKVLEQEMIGLLKERFSQTKNKTLYLRADYGIKYGLVAKVMSNLKSRGIAQIALVTEVDKNE